MCSLRRTNSSIDGLMRCMHDPEMQHLVRDCLVASYIARCTSPATPLFFHQQLSTVTSPTPKTTSVCESLAPIGGGRGVCCSVVAVQVLDSHATAAVISDSTTRITSSVRDSLCRKDAPLHTTVTQNRSTAYCALTLMRHAER